MRLLAILAALASASTSRGAPPDVRLRLATTTSTEASGLLAHLLPPFERSCRCKVDVIAVGTGKALALGRRGDVDVVLVHARALEDEFVAGGWGIDRRDVMYNGFVVVGPPEDPASVRGSPNAREAFRRIAARGAAFVSRGDRSGTHEKELEIWKRVGVTPTAPWYLESGQGMSEVLTMASERQAYTLADRATLLAHPRRATLPVLLEDDPILFNPYGVMAVNPKRHPSANHELAARFAAFLTGEEGRRLIASFTIEGRQLFLLPGGNPP